MGQAMNLNHRIKGETALPVHTLALLGKVGVTRAAKEIGTSTTTLHKARKTNVVSKVVEVAAGNVLEHLGDVATHIAEHRTLPKVKPTGRPDAMFLLSVSADKAPLVEQFAKALRAEIIAA